MGLVFKQQDAERYAASTEIAMELTATGALRASGFARLSLLGRRHYRARDSSAARDETGAADSSRCTTLAAEAPRSHRPKTAATVRRGAAAESGGGHIGASVLADSAVEHYRGSFKNKAMFTPLVVSRADARCVSVHGTRTAAAVRIAVRDIVYAVAAADRPGRHRAFTSTTSARGPAASPGRTCSIARRSARRWRFCLSGLLGFLRRARARHAPGAPPTIFELPAGRAWRRVTGAGLLGTPAKPGCCISAAPSTIRSCSAGHAPADRRAAAGIAAVGHAEAATLVTRWWLRLTALLGFAGVGFHAIGVARNMGGWRNWSQNVLNGPPLPAPPSFTGLALAGLAALGLMEDHPDA